MGSSMTWIFTRACPCILNLFKLTGAIITWRYLNVFKTQVNESDTMDFVLSLLNIESTIVDRLDSNLNAEPFCVTANSIHYELIGFIMNFISPLKNDL